MKHNNLLSYVLISVIVLFNGVLPSFFYRSPQIINDFTQPDHQLFYQLTEFDFRYAPGIDVFSIAEFVDSKNPTVNKCYRSNDNLSTKFSQRVQDISEESGVNPRINLVLVDLNFNIFTSTEVIANCDSIFSFLDLLQITSHHMMEAWVYYQIEDYGLDKDSSSFTLNREDFQNGIEYAVLEGMRNIPGLSQKDIIDFEYRFYENFSGSSDTLIDSIEEINSTVSYRLPFTGRHSYSSGPHGGNTTDPCKSVDLSAASGLDFAGSFPENGDLNDAVVAIAPGTIVGIKESDSAPGGKWVAIQHSNGVVSMYWHLFSISPALQINDNVSYGAYLGERGNTGCIGCGVHIHLELRIGGSNYNVYSGIGDPVNWHGKIIDGYLIDSITKSDGRAANYQGTAIITANVLGTSIKQFTMCGVSVNAVVEPNFPHNTPINSDNTLFADENPISILYSSNDAYFYCSNFSGQSGNTPILGKTPYPQGICDIPPDPSDTIPPSGNYLSPTNGSTISERTVTISANASDNSGGSGVREVRFSAKWGGNWYGIGTASSSPFNINWDMCNAMVPNGDIELGMEVWDNANNKWVYSEHFPNPHIIKNYSCEGGGGLPAVGFWNAEAWMNKDMAGYVNKNEHWSEFYIEKDWGTNAPYPGFPADQFSFKIYRDVPFNGGQYFFRVCSDDGVRLLVDNEMKINEWWDRGGCLQTDKWLSSGYHPVEIQYYENTGNAYIKLYTWGEEFPRPELDEPDGRITSPANNIYISQNPLTIWADAWDDVAGVNRVVFRVYHCVGGCQWRVLGTSYSPPYQYNNWDWSALDGQQIKLAIDVYDNSGKSKTGAGGEVTVNFDKISPTASILSPVSNTIDEDKLVNIVVNAADSGSGIGSVRFFAGYEGDTNYWHEIGTDTNSADGWGMVWNGSSLPNGTITNIYAIAYDRAGNSTGATAINITIGKPDKKVIYLPIIGNKFTATPPVSSQIVFVSTQDGNKEIYLMNLDGTGLLRLTNNAVDDIDPSFSADGSKIIFSSYRTGKRQIYTMLPDGSQQTRMMTDSYDEHTPEWSPNGAKIAFTRYANFDGSGVRGEVFVMNSDGSNLTRLTYTTGQTNSNQHGCWFSGWSPASTQIVYYCYVGYNQIWIMNDDGSNQHRILQDTYWNSIPKVSPDGMKIVFVSYRYNNYDVYTVNLDGSSLSRLTTSSADEWAPTWSIDGQKILFESKRDGKTQVYMMNIDGTNQERLTDNTAYAGQPQWRPVGLTAE